MSDHGLQTRTSEGSWQDREWKEQGDRGLEITKGSERQRGRHVTRRARSTSESLESGSWGQSSQSGRNNHWSQKEAEEAWGHSGTARGSEPGLGRGWPQEGDKPEAAVTRKGGAESTNDVAQGLGTWPRLYLASLSKSHASPGLPCLHLWNQKAGLWSSRFLNYTR